MRKFTPSALALLAACAGATGASAVPSIGAFSTPFSLPTSPPPSPNGFMQQEFTVAPDGNIIAGWVSNGGQIPAPAQVRVRSGGVWSSVSTLNTGLRTSVLSLPARTSTDGNSIAVWSSFTGGSPTVYTMYACPYAAASAAWCNSPTLMRTLSGQSLDPDVTMLPDGRAVAVWTEFSVSPGYVQVLASRFAGGSWTTPEVISEAGSSAATGARRPAIASDDDGNVLVVYVTGSGSVGDPDVIHQTRLPAGSGTWTTPGLVMQPDVDLNTIDQRPTVSMAGSGTSVVAYQAEDSNDAYGHAVVSTDAGATWTTPEPLAPYPAAPTYESRGAASPTGEVMAVFERDSIGNVQARRWTPDAGWSSATTLPTVAGGRSDAAGVAFDGAGNALAVWRERVATIAPSIWGRRFDRASDAWSAPAQISAQGSNDSATSPGIALAPRGSGLVSWNAPVNTRDLLASTYVAPDTVPWAPGRPTATAGDARADVSWAAPAFDGGQPVTSYTVTATPGGATCTARAPQTSCAVTGLSNGIAYTFRVTAENAIGASSPSVASAPVTPAQPSSPSTPSVSPVIPGLVPALGFASRTTAATGSRSVALTTLVRVNGQGRVVQVGRRGATATAHGLASPTAGPVACTARRGVPRAGTYRVTCTLGAASRAALTQRSLRVRLATTFIAADGQRVTRATWVRIKRLPPPRVPVTG